MINACDRILTTLHGLLLEADGIRAALELDEQLPLLRLIEEAAETLEGSLQSRLVPSVHLTKSEHMLADSLTKVGDKYGYHSFLKAVFNIASFK